MIAGFPNPGIDPAIGQPRQDEKRAARVARQVRGGASEHQSADRAVAARADDEQIHAGAEGGELLAGETECDLPLDVAEGGEVILRFRQLLLAARRCRTTPRTSPA